MNSLTLQRTLPLELAPPFFKRNHQIKSKQITEKRGPSPALLLSKLQPYAVIGLPTSNYTDQRS